MKEYEEIIALYNTAYEVYCIANPEDINRNAFHAGFIAGMESLAKVYILELKNNNTPMQDTTPGIPHTSHLDPKPNLN